MEEKREREREKLKVEKIRKIKLIILKAKYIFKEEVVNNYIIYIILIIIYSAAS